MTIGPDLLADTISAGVAEALRNNADQHTKWRTGQVTAVINDEDASRQVEVHLDGDPAGVTVRMRTLGGVQAGQRALVVFSAGGGVWCIGALGGVADEPVGVVDPIILGEPDVDTSDPDYDPGTAGQRAELASGDPYGCPTVMLNTVSLSDGNHTVPSGFSSQDKCYIEACKQRTSLGQKRRVDYAPADEYATGSAFLDTYGMNAGPDHVTNQFSEMEVNCQWFGNNGSTQREGNAWLYTRADATYAEAVLDLESTDGSNRTEITLTSSTSVYEFIVFTRGFTKLYFGNDWPGFAAGTDVFGIFGKGDDPHAQQGPIANANGTLADLTTKFNQLLQALRNYGWLAT